MMDTLARALKAQNVSDHKIAFILEKLHNIPDTNTDDAIWRTFCNSCLEVGIDPQAVFAQAVSNFDDAVDNTGDKTP